MRKLEGGGGGGGGKRAVRGSQREEKNRKIRRDLPDSSQKCENWRE